MAETQTATTGYMGEVWFHNGSTLYELREVRSFNIGSRSREMADKTTLKSPDWEREDIPTFFAPREAKVVLVCRRLSDTHTMLEAAAGEADFRAIKFVHAETGEPTSQEEGTGRVIAVEYSDENAEDVVEMTVTFRVKLGATAAYAA
jgi:hypothetical protein